VVELEELERVADGVNTSYDLSWSDACEERAEEAPDGPLSAFLREMGRHEVLPHEEQARLVALFQRGLRSAEVLARHTGLTVEEVRYWARRKLLGFPLEGDQLIEERIKALPGEVRRERHVLLEGEEALNRLIETNLRFVVHVAKGQTRRGIPLTDLIGPGVQGLVDAAVRYDLRKGVHFSTYAYWWIRLRTQQAARGLAGPELLSLDDPMGEEGQATKGDFVPSGEDVAARAIHRVLEERLASSIAKLPPEEQRVLRRTEGLDGRPRTRAEEAARLLGMTPEALRSKRREALAKLKALLQG